VFAGDYLYRTMIIFFVGLCGLGNMLRRDTALLIGVLTAYDLLLLEEEILKVYENVRLSASSRTRKSMWLEVGKHGASPVK